MLCFVVYTSITISSRYVAIPDKPGSHVCLSQLYLVGVKCAGGYPRNVCCLLVVVRYIPVISSYDVKEIPLYHLVLEFFAFMKQFMFTLNFKILLCFFTSTDPDQINRIQSKIDRMLKHHFILYLMQFHGNLSLLNDIITS